MTENQHAKIRTELQWKAWLETGVKESVTPASGNAVGIFWVPGCQDPIKRTRSFARSQYHDKAKTRPNYHLLINHEVLDITFSDKVHATGIRFRSRNSTDVIIVKAKREVALAAGSLHSPQILQRSGIGPKALLRQAKIPVRVDLPGVGQNFRRPA